MSLALIIFAAILMLQEAWTFDKYTCRPKGVKKEWTSYARTWLKFLTMAGLLFFGFASTGAEPLWGLLAVSLVIPLFVVNLFGKIFLRLKVR